jgi:hypothetical protein
MALGVMHEVGGKNVLETYQVDMESRRTNGLDSSDPREIDG